MSIDSFDTHDSGDEDGSLISAIGDCGGIRKAESHLCLFFSADDLIETVGRGTNVTTTVTRAADQSREQLVPGGLRFSADEAVRIWPETR